MRVRSGAYLPNFSDFPHLITIQVLEYLTLEMGKPKVSVAGFLRD
jgi:hypothetical protein